MESFESIKRRFFSPNASGLIGFYFVLNIALPFKIFKTKVPRTTDSHAQSKVNMEIHTRDNESCSTQQPQNVKRKKTKNNQNTYGTSCGVYHEHACALLLATYGNLPG